MAIKHLLRPAQVRRIPAQFSWIDQRLVRDKHIGSCGADALAFYLFLVTVADANGLSYYSDHSILSRLVCFDSDRLAQARTQLQHLGWIAYEQPLYQVLAVDHFIRSSAPTSVVPKTHTPRRTRDSAHIADLLRRALAGRHD